MEDPIDDDPVRLPIAPELDLHSFQPRDVVSVVEEYLHAAADAGLTEVRLVHGRGRGVQRGLVQAALEAHPAVRAFWDDPHAHLGATVAALGRREPD
ncbi:MAG: Smr/MutS family protein [Vicinamibacterales bacterium]